MTRKVKSQLTIEKPASVTTPTWDFLIFFSGNLYPSKFNNQANNLFDTVAAQYFNNGVVIVPNPLVKYPVNTIQVYAVPSGADVFPVDNTWNDTNLDRFTSINFEDFVFDDRVRLLGGAFELEDDTPEIYRGGNIRILDVPCSWTKAQVPIIRNDLGGGTQSMFAERPAILMNAPPANIKQAAQYAGSVAWGAEEGCYAVLKQSKLDNPFSPPLTAVPIYSAGLDAISDTFTNPLQGQACVMNAGAWSVDSTGNGALPNQLRVEGPIVLPASFDMKVIHVTGVQEQARFTFYANMLFETLPTAEDLKELALAVPSPDWDENAMILYSHIANSLPPAVPFADNASGDWFKSIASALRDYAPTIGSALGTVIPGAGLIGNALGKAGGLAADNADKIEGAFSKMRINAQEARDAATAKRKEKKAAKKTNPAAAPKPASKPRPAAKKK